MGSRALQRHRQQEAATARDDAAWDDPTAVALSAYCGFPSLQDPDGMARARLAADRQVRELAGQAARSAPRYHTIPALPAGAVRAVLDAAVGVAPAERDALLAYCGRNPDGGVMVASVLVDPAAAGPLAEETAARLAASEPPVPLAPNV